MRNPDESGVELGGGDYPVDEQEVEERLFELYKLQCLQSNITPTIRDFVIWKEERFK